MFLIGHGLLRRPRAVAVPSCRALLWAHPFSRIRVLPGFPAPERFGNGCVTRNELCLRHVRDRQEDVLRVARGGIVEANPDGLALEAEQNAAKASSAFQCDGKLDFDTLSGK